MNALHYAPISRHHRTSYDDRYPRRVIHLSMCEPASTLQASTFPSAQSVVSRFPHTSRLTPTSCLMPPSSKLLSSGESASASASASERKFTKVSLSQKALRLSLGLLYSYTPNIQEVLGSNLYFGSNLMSFRNSASSSVFQTPKRSPTSNGISLTGSGSVSRFSQPLKPAIPVAREIFEPQLKWVLRRRLVRLVAVCSIILLATAAVSDAPSSKDWVSWCLQSGLKALLWTLGGIIPPIIARKVSVRGEFFTGFCS